jgi:hypothetical protein
MFSKDFAMTLNSSLAAIQQDPTGSQPPAVQHLTKVLRVLWREVERLERSVRVSDSEIVLTTGDASIVLKKDGSVVIRARRIAIEADMDVAVKAGQNVVLKGSKIVQN